MTNYARLLALHKGRVSEKHVLDVFWKVYNLRCAAQSRGHAVECSTLMKVEDEYLRTYGKLIVDDAKQNDLCPNIIDGLLGRLGYSNPNNPTAPTHYALEPEPIAAIEGWELGFNLGNVVKYIARAKHKGTERQDLEKALYYLKRELGITQ